MHHKENPGKINIIGLAFHFLYQKESHEDHFRVITTEKRRISMKGWFGRKESTQQHTAGRSKKVIFRW